MVSALVSGSRGPCSSPGWPGTLCCILRQDAFLTSGRFMLQKLEISDGLMGHLARKQTLPTFYLRHVSGDFESGI